VRRRFLGFLGSTACFAGLLVGAAVAQTSSVTIDGRASVFSPSGFPLPPGALRPFERLAVGGEAFSVSASGSVTPQVGTPEWSTPSPDGSTQPHPALVAADNNLSPVESPRFMFLAGMFAGSSLPLAQVPGLGNLLGNEVSVSAKLGQVFWVGDGVTDAGVKQRFVAPVGATRFVLGFVDAGAPGLVPGGYGDNGGSLNVVVDSQVSPPVVISSAKPFKIVLLGDSYTAGNGAGRYGAPTDCFRSSKNWGNRYAEYLRVTKGYQVSVVNRACSGSYVKNLTSGRVMCDTFESCTVTRTVYAPDVGVSIPVDVNDPATRAAFQNAACVKKSPDERFTLKTISSLLPDPLFFSVVCTRSLAPQLDAVSTDTDLVLFSVGANDAGFAEIVANCFVKGSRDPGSCRTNIDKARTLILSQKDDGLTFQTRAALSAIRAKMRPGARVVLLQYPYLERYETYKVRSLTNRTGGLGDVFDAGREVRQLGREGDIAQIDAVNQANAAAGENFVTYADGVKSVFAGPPSHEPQGDGKNPDRWIVEPTDALKTFRTWYHPNPAGHQALSEVVGGLGASFTIPSTTVGDAIDVALVVNTSAQSAADLVGLKRDVVSLTDQIRARSGNARFSLVEYRDFAVRSGNSADFVARVDVGFGDAAAVVGGVNALVAGGSSGTKHSMYSGLNTAFKLPWRPAARKAVLVFSGGSGALDPEPLSFLTSNTIIAEALALDPAEVSVISSGPLDASVETVVSKTGGFAAGSSPEVVDAARTVFDKFFSKPYGWVGESYVGRVGESMTFDASGSHGVTAEIVSYAWDFNGDGVADQTTTEPTATFTPTVQVSGLVVVRVTDQQGQVSAASASLSVTRDGDLIPDETDNCPDDPEPSNTDTDGDGVGDVCDPTPVKNEKPGVVASNSDVRFGVATATLNGASATITIQSSVPANQSGTLAVRVVGPDSAITGTFAVPVNVLASAASTVVTLPPGWQRGPGLYRFEIVYTGTDGRTEVPDNDPLLTLTATDTVAPNVAGSPDRAPNPGGWYNAPVTLRWSTVDPTPSSGAPTQPAPVVVSTEGANQTIRSGPSCDPAGNCGTGTATISLDTTPPTITITGNAGTYTPTDQITINCQVTDALSGVATQSCPGVNMLAANVGPGLRSYTATATDKAGNTTTKTYTFTVAEPTGLIQPKACSIELDAKTTTSTSFTATIQIANNGVALPKWHLSWTYRANEQLTGLAVTATPNALIYKTGPTADIYGYGDNATMRAGDSLRSPIRITGTWTAQSTKATRPTGFTLNGTPCTTNAHGTRYDQ
jgi:GDSL-like Lipase/Acylhydrolase family/Cellulose binding domain